MNVDKQPAWLLHTRPFRDTSLLLDLLTPEHGRVSALARGVRGPRSRNRALLQPFQPLTVSLSGRGELLSLREAEAAGCALVLTGEHLFAALYVNELMVRLLHGHQGELELFRLYGEVLRGLSEHADMEPLLRTFELRVLEALGFGLQFAHEAESDAKLNADHWYYLHADGGFVRQSQAVPELPMLAQPRAGSAHNIYPGSMLLRIAARDFADTATRACAKRLLREVLQQHLPERPLASRELFRQLH